MFPFCMPVDLRTRMPYVYMFVSNFFGQIIPCIMHASDTVNPTCYQCPICQEDTEDFWDATLFQNQLENQEKYNTVSYTTTTDNNNMYLSEVCTAGHTVCSDCADRIHDAAPGGSNCPSCRIPVIARDQRRTIPLFIKNASETRKLDKQKKTFNELHDTIDKPDGSGTLLKKKKLADEQASAQMTSASKEARQQALARLTTRNIILPMHTVQQHDNPLHTAQLQTAQLTIDRLLTQAPPTRQHYTDMLFANVASTPETTPMRERLENRQAARAHRKSLMPPGERRQLDKILQDGLQLDFDIAIREKSLQRAQNARPDYKLILDQRDPTWRQRIQRGHGLGLPPRGWHVW